MINKLKYWLLTKLLQDDNLLNQIYIKQIVQQHITDHEEHMKYRFRVELNER